MLTEDTVEFDKLDMDQRLRGYATLINLATDETLPCRIAEVSRDNFAVYSLDTWPVAARKRVLKRDQWDIYASNPIQCGWMVFPMCYDLVHPNDGIGRDIKEGYTLGMVESYVGGGNLGVTYILPHVSEVDEGEYHGCVYLSRVWKRQWNKTDKVSRFLMGSSRLTTGGNTYSYVPRVPADAMLDWVAYKGGEYKFPNLGEARSYFNRIKTLQPSSGTGDHVFMDDKHYGRRRVDSTLPLELPLSRNFSVMTRPKRKTLSVCYNCEEVGSVTATDQLRINSNIQTAATMLLDEWDREVHIK